MHVFASRGRVIFAFLHLNHSIDLVYMHMQLYHEILQYEIYSLKELKYINIIAQNKERPEGYLGLQRVPKFLCACVSSAIFLASHSQPLSYTILLEEVLGEKK